MIVKASIRDDFCPGRLSRRELVFGVGAASLAASMGHAQAAEPAVDYTIRIGPVSLELAPGKTIKTTGYNGSVPGPILRLREGRPVNIKVINDAGYPDLVHWHGLYLPALQDGATEEGSPIIPVGQSLLYSLHAEASGHAVVPQPRNGDDGPNAQHLLGRIRLSLLEPAAGDPGRYDREVLLAARHWEGSWVSMQDIHKGPPPDNGLEVMYHSATLGERTLGHDEPIRVRDGERVLFRLLNASASMDVSLALSGHRFTVIALDGNPVPTPTTVDVLTLDVAERADVIVEMNNPGVWIFGSTDDEDRNMGMGVVIEYENRSGEPQWRAPAKAAWDYAAFARPTSGKTPDETINLTFEKVPAAAAATIAGLSTASHGPIPIRCSRSEKANAIVFCSTTTAAILTPLHMHRHTFEVTKVRDTSMSGLMKDTISLPRYSTAEIDLLADDPGPTFFHCHHQDHMDEGFAGLITYS